MVFSNALAQCQPDAVSDVLVPLVQPLEHIKNAA